MRSRIAIVLCAGGLVLLACEAPPPLVADESSHRELTTGEVKWTLKGMGWANVLVARDKLLVLRESGELVLMGASPSGHAEVGRAQELEGPCWTVPALARGRIYCRSNKGEVVCLDVGGNGQGISPPRRQGAKDDNGIQPPMDADSRR